MKRVILPLLVLFGLSMLFALESAPSDVVGYIQYTIGANDYMFVSVPFGTDFTVVSELAGDIGTGSEIASVSFWQNEGWSQYVAGYPGTDFALTSGNTYFVSNGDANPITYYTEGVVGDPATFDIAEDDYTQIMLPLDRSDLATAMALYEDIGGTDEAINGINSVSTWANGGWVQFVEGYPGTDFAIAIGDGFLIDSDTAYAGWNGTVGVRNQTRQIESAGDNVATKEIKE